MVLSTATGFVNWRTEDATDLDYLPLPLITRNNLEESFQFTQEVRLASAANALLRSDDVTLRWQTGLFLFTQNYQQDAANTFAPAVLFQLVGFPIDFPVTQRSPQSDLDDFGVGVYGQGTLTFGSRFDLIAGVRADYEQKDAVLSTFSTPPLLFPPTNVVAERDFSDVSPQFAGAMRLTPSKTIYGSLSRGFKAGGFNAASPVGNEAYGEEHTWSLEGGVKTAWAGGRVMANASVFRIDWEDLQSNCRTLRPDNSSSTTPRRR